MNICSIADCDNDKIMAKGLCRLHYRRTRPRTPDKPKLVQCDGCGIEILRHKSKRYPKSYCSDICSHWDQWGAWTSTWKPPVEHTAPIDKQNAHPPITGILVAGSCYDCGTAFVTLSTTGLATYCSDQCTARTARRRRRAREHQAVGSYRYSDIMRQYTKQGRVCAYCEQPCVGLPEPEHVTALSRGGRNDMSNLVAACHLCNSDKCDLSLEEWAADRARRGLPPVNTRLYGGDIRYLHLWPNEPTGEASRMPSRAA